MSYIVTVNLRLVATFIKLNTKSKIVSNIVIKD